MEDKIPTKEEIYEEKAQERRRLAKLPVAEKFQIICRLQWRHYELKKAVGRKPKRPWQMPVEEYKALWGDEFTDINKVV